MDSAWPMHGHDIFHTGRSPYSTAQNTGYEKWRFDADRYVDGSAVIDENGTIYFGDYIYFYALFPNGTQKWKTKLRPIICVYGTSPAIDENGVIYVPTDLKGFYAINQDGTIKWKLNENVDTSPVIGNDGTIYFCVEYPGCVKALHPNGTVKWSYNTSGLMQSSPAIGLDGTIYCGSHDNYVYALYPNNGTLRWKYKTGAWVHGSPSIGSDGTVYIGSDDNYLYALYPNNGTMKWKVMVGGMRCSPSIDKDGILYFGVNAGKFYAIYPDGTIKWSFNLGWGNSVWGSTAAISDDGTIYFGTCISSLTEFGGDIIALNSDGSEKWRMRIGDEPVTSSPCIAEDGTVYIGSIDKMWRGYLHAFNALDPNAPSKPIINGPKYGKAGKEIEYKFSSNSPLGKNVYYYIKWGDGKIENWIGPYPSGEEIKVKHSWDRWGIYQIQVRAKDTDNLWGPWGELEVTMPRNRATYNLLLLKFLEHLCLVRQRYF